MKLSKRKCKQCKVEFQKTEPLQYVCSVGCTLNRLYDLNKAKREKAINEKVKGMKKGLMNKSDWINLFQKVFNTFIRIRDKDEPCISCGCTTSNKWDAGHLFPTTYSGLRFNEDNVNKQCSFNCNLSKSGNVFEYRIGLEKKIGTHRMQVLHNLRHQKLELTIVEIQDYIKLYKSKIKELKK